MLHLKPTANLKRNNFFTFSVSEFQAARTKAAAERTAAPYAGAAQGGRAAVRSDAPPRCARPLLTHGEIRRENERSVVTLKFYLFSSIASFFSFSACI